MATKDDTSAQCQRNIESIAQEVLSTHTITKMEDGSWLCARKNKSSGYHFCVFTSPGMVVVWGDLGEFVIRHSDADSLGWWLTAGSRDYLLGKIQACAGNKREFFPGDAFQHLDDLQKEEPSAKFLGDIEHVRGEMEESEYDDAESLKRVWWEAWSERGDGDPASCEGWSSGPLWLWEMCKCFRRLHTALDPQAAP